MRNTVWLVVVLLLMLVAPAALAQESNVNTVTFNGFSFDYDSALGSVLTIVQQPGDSPEVQQPGGPVAPHTYYALSDQSSEPTFPEFAPLIIRVYRVADLAPYDELQANLTALRSLIDNQPDLSGYINVSDDMAAGQQLPFLYGTGASQVMRAQPRYVNLGDIKGVTYLTVFRHDVSPFFSGDFVYTFQGITSDGQHAISAQFNVSTPLFPAEPTADFDYDSFAAGYIQYVRDSVATLTSATPVQFSPSLNMLDAILESFSFAPVSAGAEGQATAPQSTPTPMPETAPPSDPSFGGLGGREWTLVSYGDPAAPLEALPEAPASIAFGIDGVTGNTGCNSFGGTFTYENNTLVFSPLNSTRIACAENILVQEADFLAALATASTYRIEGETLQIFYEGGTQVLNFTAS